MTRYAAVLAFALAVPAALAAPAWRMIFDRGGHRIYLDDASIHRDHRGARALLRFEYAGEVPAQGAAPAYRSSLEARRFDCDARSSGIESQTLFPLPDEHGHVLRSLRMRTVTMEPVQTRTVGEAVLDAVCGA